MIRAGAAVVLALAIAGVGAGSTGASARSVPAFASSALTGAVAARGAVRSTPAGMAAARAALLRRSDLGLREGAIVYWCGQSLQKHLPQWDGLFARIARQVGDCQFAFLEAPAAPRLNALFRERMPASLRQTS